MDITICLYIFNNVFLSVLVMQKIHNKVGHHLDLAMTEVKVA